MAQSGTAQTSETVARSQCRRVHLAVLIDYDRGAILASDVEQALEHGLAAPSLSSEPRRVEAKAVIVSEGLHDRLLDAGAARGAS